MLASARWVSWRAQRRFSLQTEISGYQIGAFTLDLDNNIVLDARGETVEIPTRGLQFLTELARHYPNPVSKASLHKTLWPDRQVSDWALSRLVSDTRLLLQDDGKQQGLIKTSHGIGYSLRQCKELPRKGGSDATKDATPEGWLRVKSMRLYFVFLAIILLASVQLYGVIKHRQLVGAMEQIARYQEAAFKAFQAQSTRRDELVDMVTTRLGVQKGREYEKFISYYYPHFNREERFVFDQIRAITESSLYQNNKAIYLLLERNPEIFREIPAAQALFNHLTFWLNKYRSVFLKRKDLGVLYAGVEDGVPYPSEVDQQVKSWLAENR